jgi:tetratricopeptide (TPR) repeat protein
MLLGMHLAERSLRIFVSSPSDVAAERVRVKLVADRLNAQLEGIVRLEVLRWEDAFYSAAHSFQEAIDQAIGNMSMTDMVLCIVWKRAGLKLNPAIWRRPDGSAYESGTVLEFETAVEVSRKRNGIPDVFLFRKSAPVVYEADRAVEQMEQFELLKAVWKRWTESDEGYNAAGYQSFADPDDFEQKLEACLRQWLERRGVVALGPHWDRKLKGSPFRGLAAFEASHSSVFFGRESAIARAIAKLRQAPFLLIIGASGSGKSSLLRAGLLPRATAPGVIPDVDQWRTVVIDAGGDPSTTFTEALFADDVLGLELRAGDFRDPQALAELLATAGGAAVAPIRAALARAAEKRKEALHYEETRLARLFIALDQVERLFVEVAPERVETFARLLRALVEAGLASLVLVLRSDTYGRFQTVASFLALLESHGTSFDLLPPTAAELEEIVTRPVAACHPPLAFETDAHGRSLAEALVADARGGDALPLLQMTLQRLFDAESARGDGVLRFADYPGIDAAVTRTAEEAVAGLEARARSALPALITAFVRDVTVAPDGGLEALVIVPVARAAFERGDPARASLIDEFVARRLLTAAEVGGRVLLRPVHEALLRVVPAAVAIIKENAALIRVRNTLDPMVAEWVAAPDRAKPDFLATSAALIAGAAQLQERFGDELSVEMRCFIAESLAAAARRRDAERTRQRRALAATAAGLVVALALAALAALQWRSAEEQKRIAEIAHRRAQTALDAAANAADTLIFDLAQEFRRRSGMPVDLIRLILERVQRLELQLAESGERTPNLRRLEAVAFDELYATYVALGDTKAAIAAAERGRAILEELVKALPDDERIQRDLVISINNNGDVRFQANARWEESLKLYREALAIIEPLARRFPERAQLQNDWATSLTKVADMLFTGEQRDEALRTYRQALEIVQTIADAEPNDPRWQASLVFTRGRIGLVLSALGRNEEALKEYRANVELSDKLADAQPKNTELQRRLFFALNRLATASSKLGLADDAVVAMSRALKIITALAATDLGNASWQRDVAIAHDEYGDILRTAKQPERALEAYRQSMAIREKLVAIDSRNVPWRRELANVYEKMGDLLVQAKDLDGALELSRRLIDLRQGLLDPANLQSLGDLARAQFRAGTVLAALGRGDEAVARFRANLAMVEQLTKAAPDNVRAQTSVIAALFQLAIAGDDARPRLERARDIAHKLQADGKLPEDQKFWVEAIEQGLATLPN